VTTRSCCTCDVDGLLIGIDVDEVQEVLRHQTVTAVPLTDPSVAGLLNLRGQIVTVIDARRRLGLPDRSDDRSPAHVILHSDGETVSLVIDSEGDVVDVSDRDIDPVPPTVNPVLRGFLRGAYQLDGALLLVLDTDRVVSVTGR
jgi:purine-binding chemotaxis protein CheW